METKIPIFIMIKRYNAFTIKCLKNLFKYTGSSQYKLTIINNGKIDDNEIILDKIEDGVDVEFVDFDQEVSVAFAYNFAIKQQLKDEEFFIILHNDCFVSPNWLDNMVFCYGQNKDDVNFYAIYPRSNYYGHDNDLELHKHFVKNKLSQMEYLTIDDIEKNIKKVYPEGFEKYCEDVTKNNIELYSVKTDCFGFCALIKSDLFLQTLFVFLQRHAKLNFKITCKICTKSVHYY